MTEQGSPTLKEKINQAFMSLHPADRKPYSNREAARWLADTAGAGEPTISENYIAMLRSGERDNPTVRHLQALARFFGISVTYFLEDGDTTEAIHSDLQVVAAMRDAEVRNIAARAMDMDPAMRSWLSDMVTTLPTGQTRRPSRRRRFQLGEAGDSVERGLPPQQSPSESDIPEGPAEPN